MLLGTIHCHIRHSCCDVSVLQQRWKPCLRSVPGISLRRKEAMEALRTEHLNGFWELTGLMAQEVFEGWHLWSSWFILRRKGRSSVSCSSANSSTVFETKHSTISNTSSNFLQQIRDQIFSIISHKTDWHSLKNELNPKLFQFTNSSTNTDMLYSTGLKLANEHLQKGAPKKSE